MRSQDYSIFKSLSAKSTEPTEQQYPKPADIEARIKEIDDKIEEYRRIALITRDPDEYDQYISFILELLREKQWLILQQLY